MANTGKVVLYAENKIKEGLDSAKKDLLGFEDAMASIGKNLTNAFKITAIVASLKKLGEAAFDTFKEFGESERRLRQLSIALDDNAVSIDKATKLIKEMSSISLASKDDIEALVAELASLGKSDTEIDAITRAAVNLSNITGKDLNSSFTLINSTYSGTLGKLEKLLPELGNLSKEQLAAGAAADAINSKFGDMSIKLAENDIPQKLKNLKDEFSNLKENIGEQTATFFNPVVEGIRTIVKAWNDAYEANKKYKDNAATTNDVETKNAGLRLKAAVENAKIDQEKYYQAWRMTMVSTPGLFNIINGEKTPIYTPKQAYEMGGIGGKENLGKYFESMGNVFAYQQALDRYSTANPNWNKPNTPTTPTTTTGDKDEPSWMKVQRQVLGVEPVAGSNADIDNFITKIKNINDGLVELGDISNEESKQNVANQIFDAIRSLVESGEFSATEGTIKYLLSKYNEAKEEIPEPVIIPDSDSWSKHYQAMGNTIAEAVKVKSLDFRNYAQEEADTSNYDALQTAWEKTLYFKPNVSDEDDAANYAALDTIAENLKVASQALEVKNWIDSENLAWFNQQTTRKSSDIVDDSWIVKFDEEDTANFAALDVIAENIIAIDKRNQEWIAKFDESDAANLAALDTIAENIKSAELNKEVQDYVNQDNQDWFVQYRPELDFTNPEADAADEANFAALDVIAANLKPLDILGNTIDSALYGLKETFSNTFNLKSMQDTGLDRNQIFGQLEQSFGSLTSSLQPLMQILFSANPLLAALIPVLQGFVSVIGPVLEQLIKPLMDSLTGIGILLANLIIPIFNALSGPINIIANLLITAISPVLNMLSPIISLVALAFQLLQPLLILIAQAFTILMSPVEFLADLFTWLGEWIKTLGTNIGIAIYNLSHWFNQKSFVSGPDGFTSDAFTGLGDKLEAIANISNSDFTTTATASNSGASASYTGGNTITINIFQNAPIVGDGGITDFARMIRNEFLMLDYYNEPR